MLAPDGMLHLVWTATDGIYHAQAAATAAIQRGAWSPAAVVSGGDTCVGDLVLWAQRPGVVFQQAQTWRLRATR
ncbi:MAG TPA: hypothetical protein EYQ31_04645 [Candidatus Handelsmanbacteria bacterium]|nr:hypothetical protein [Candidatus Handelsmanbacteria bacterium]